KGAAFRVFLPVVPHAGRAPQPEAAGQAMEDVSVGAGPPGTAGDASILVVDDEAGVRALVVRVLRERGYRVSEAKDGAGALRVVEEAGTAPDLALTDINLPDMSGRELGRRLRDQAGARRFLFMSGFAEADTVEGDGPQGAFVEKPFTPAALVEAVEKALGR
ncbi:MAG TPA: response regulator, partial [Longimicrobiales bacterium]|nr:response regulator [Longimicrobiales bacterium]